MDKTELITALTMLFGRVPDTVEADYVRWVLYAPAGVRLGSLFVNDNTCNLVYSFDHNERDQMRVPFSETITMLQEEEII